MGRGIGKRGLAIAATASAAAFALADGYAATLLSMAGPAIGNLMAAASRTIPHMLANGILSAEPACLATGLVAACAVWTA